MKNKVKQYFENQKINCVEFDLNNTTDIILYDKNLNKPATGKLFMLNDDLYGCVSYNGTGYYIDIDNDKELSSVLELLEKKQYMVVE
jgi:hypothetical protein